VMVGLSKTGMMLTGAPQEDKRAPKSVVDGQFSSHFTVAVMLRQGKLTWDDYGKQLADQRTLALTRRATAFEDPRVEANYPNLLSGSLKIVMRDGTAYESFQRVPKGDPENFVTPDEVRAKFASLVRPCLGGAGEVALYDAAMQLDERGVANLFAATMAIDLQRAAAMG